MTRVYIDMVGDLFHVGHLNIIKNAKKLGDYLIVGVHNDKDVASYKRIPFINEKDRYAIVEACKYVDKIIKGSPLYITHQFLKDNKIDLVVHGSDKSPHFAKQYAIPISEGMMKYLPYTEGISTTHLINKIKQS